LSNRGNGIATALKNERKTLTLPVINAKGPPQGLPAASGPHRGAGSRLGPPPRPRAAVYVDGFNLFHAIDDLKENHLKWLDLMALSKHLAGVNRDVVRVVWCSAKHPDPEKAERWMVYRNALLATGVKVVSGHFTEKPPIAEKEGDVSVALHLMLDAIDDVYDIAYLISADSDQVATAKLFKERFGPSSATPKKLHSVAPPNRPHSGHIKSYVDHCADLSKAEIGNHLLPSQLKRIDGRPILCPARYTPPPGWVSDRQYKLALLAAADASAKA
jgi:hypothetical protein